MRIARRLLIAVFMLTLAAMPLAPASTAAAQAMTAMTCSALIHSYIGSSLSRIQTLISGGNG